MIDKLISGVDMMTRNELIAAATDTFRDSPPKRSSTFEIKDNDEAAATAGTPIAGRQSSSGMDSTTDGSVPQGSCLYQIPLPNGMAGKTYGSLYKKLSKKGVIPLGLLRGTGSPTLIAPYVYTNPNYDTELNIYDRVFILSVKPIPDEQDCPTVSASAVTVLPLEIVVHDLCCCVFGRTRRNQLLTLQITMLPPQQEPCQDVLSNPIRFSIPTFRGPCLMDSPLIAPGHSRSSPPSLPTSSNCGRSCRRSLVTSIASLTR